MEINIRKHIMKVHRKGQTEIARDALIGRIGQDQFDELKKGRIKSTGIGWLT